MKGMMFRWGGEAGVGRAAERFEEMMLVEAGVGRAALGLVE